MKRFFPTACLVAVISLLLSVIWPCQSNAAAPVFSPLEQVRAVGMGSPGAVAVDAMGNFYVADASGGEVFKFNRFNRLMATFSLGASGNGLAVTADGAKLYVSRSTEVLIVNAASGEELGVLSGSVAQLPEFGMVGDVELDADGNVYVADLQDKKVKIYNSLGSYRTAFGTVGTANGQFHQIGSMAITPDGKVVVTDSSPLNAKVHVFTLDPIELTVKTVTAYTNGSVANFGTPAVLSPCGITFDDQGRGYLIDYLRSQVRAFGPDFLYLAAYAQSGTASGQLAAVEDLAYDPVTKRLFVTCDGGRIVLLGIDGGTTPEYVNNKPSVPAQQSPVGGSEVATASPVLQYAAATDQDGNPIVYRITVKNGAAVVFEGQTEATSIMVPAGILAENTEYLWTVEAYDSEGAASGAASPAVFVVNAVNEPPSSPTLTAPVSGEVLAGAGFLAWQSAADPDPNDTVAYQVEVAGAAGFDAPVLTARVADLEVALASFADYTDLVDGSAYAWRVAAVDSDGLVSAPGAVGQFVYDTALLEVSASLSGAKVYLGGNLGFAGRYVGVAPIAVRDLAEGALSVVVERAGFEPYIAQVNVAGTGNNAVYAALEPALQPAALQLVGNGINGRTGLDVGEAAAPFMVDFDNDGLLDLLAGAANGSLSLFPAMQLTSRGQIVFGAEKALQLPVLPGAVPFVADWNNDGRKDLLVGVADGSVKLFLNIGSEAVPAFGAGQDLAVAGSAVDFGGNAAPAVVDLNGDGAKDLVVGNAAGQVVVCFNQGDDAAPQLAAPVALFQVAGGAVPFPVDLDADGARDLLVTANGQAVPYRNDLAATGAFVVEPALAAGSFNTAFPLDVNGAKGKDLIVGQADGKLAYWAGNSSALTAAALAGLLEKADDVAALVAEVAPELLGQVSKLRGQIETGSLGGAAKTASSLAGQLPVGDARTAVEELMFLCDSDFVSSTSTKK